MEPRAGRAVSALKETDTRSAGSQVHAVRADTRDPREWLQAAPCCPLLKQYQILHLGWAKMPAPFQIVRAKLGGSYFLASLQGKGEVLVDGRWHAVQPEQAFLLPPGTLHAFRARPQSTWSFAWVRYDAQPGQTAIASANSPVLANFAGQPLLHAIQGLYWECQAPGQGTSADLWLTVIQNYVGQFAQPRSMDVRLRRLWELVESHLGDSWSSRKMAQQIQLSEKHLERLCRRELGRTPRQQLIWLRMRRAAELLRSSDRKIASIAAEVGYENPFVFSTSFKRCLGWSPSQYPREHDVGS